MKRLLVLGLKLAFSGILIAFLLKNADLDAALNKLSGASTLLIVVSTLVLSFQLIVATVRWQLVLQTLGTSLGFLKTLQITYIGAFFNQTLPSSSGGDAVRIYKAYKSGLSLSASVNSVMLERLATVLGLLLLAVLCQPFLFLRAPDVLPQWLFPLLTLIGFAGTGLLMLMDRLPTHLHQHRVIRGMVLLANDTRRVFTPKQPRTILIMVLSVIGHVNIALGVWVLGWALGINGQLTMVDCMVLVPLAILVSTLPISIGGWGVREASMVTALALVGIAAESALVLSILLGLQLIVIALPGGLVWLATSQGARPESSTDGRRQAP